jgi:hypothetical protein
MESGVPMTTWFDQNLPGQLVVAKRLVIGSVA